MEKSRPDSTLKIREQHENIPRFPADVCLDSPARPLSQAFSPLPSGSSLRPGQRKRKPLIVYFSMPETDNPLHMTRDEENNTVVVDGKVLGNTQYVAMLIRQKTGGSIFRSNLLPPTPGNTGRLSVWLRRNRPVTYVRK